MEEVVKKMNKEYFYNAMLAKALLQTVPQTDRKNLGLWIEKLSKLDGEKETLEMRNEYMKYLLLMLQNDKLIECFKKIPPAEIVPIKEVVTPKTLESIALSTDPVLTWLEGVLEETADDHKGETAAVVPSKFMENQPTPKDGIVCYVGAFSSQL